MSGVVGFIGLGKMGLGMATRLRETGHSLRLYNRTPERYAELLGDRVVGCASPAEAAQGAEVVFTMVADDAALEAVLGGEQGLLAGLAKDGLHLSCSTVSTEATRRLEGAHRERGQALVAVPVMGRPDVAGAGKVWLLAAGDRGLEPRCQPLFEALGRGYTWLGDDPVIASACKIAVNFLLFSMIESIGEAFTAVEKVGGDRAAFLEIAKLLYASGAYEGYGNRMLQSGYTPPGFTTALALKDLELMLGLAREAQSPAPLASLVRDRALASVARGCGGLDVAALVELAREEAGIRPAD
jgi:3-hydroxyisobutyrate dehydrogenase-like beta-hydroxyacid dehydrogenase